MGFNESTKFQVEREIAQLQGGRVLTWIIASLWAATVLCLFQYVDPVSETFGTWLWLISPLLIIRGAIGLVLHRRLSIDPCFRADFGLVRRFTIITGVTDCLLILSGLYVFGDLVVAHPSLFLLIAVCGLALLSLVYALIPAILVTLVTGSIAGTMILGWFSDMVLSAQMTVVGIAIALATAIGVIRFQKSYLKLLEKGYSIERQIEEASESNFVFNQHWLKTPLAAIDWDRNLIIRSWNPAAERLFGFSEEEAVGQSLDLIFAPDQVEQVRHAWTQPDFFGLEARTLRRCRSRDGSDIRTEWFDTQLHMDSEFIGVASFVVDHRDTLSFPEGLTGRPDSFPSGIRLAN